MAIPQFIVDLRTRIGHDPLWLIGVTAIVLYDDRVLLVRRSDNGVWAPVTGIVDPGEEPADAAIREVAEETGVTAVPERLVWVHATAPVVHVNGDRAQYLDHVFVLNWQAGKPYPADDESTDARWFPVTALPPMPEHLRARISAGLVAGERTRFDWTGGP
ncbi:NUDIX domain-containing protein [Mycobacterium sp. M1]|uniref:NUDIX domain-containing protein n=1 Tax=Mycolicibacter acidiphilus TaxID=2835306 RepID=A0ABS5RF77_9MYCO|nr:NUDIX domain-containing protein [Mycolicibacter acidiphilus]MBS9532238.1 NUDIX domain-containing protein [Mycolicibacter acidiphilus]